MAYVDQSQSKEKTVSFIITLIIVLGVGYAFVTGLAYNIVKKAAKDLNVIDVQDQPPPPPEPPPPPPKETPKVEVPPVVAPPPIVQAPQMQAPIIRTVPVAPPVVITPRAPPAPPPPPAPSQASGLKAKGNPASWASTDDYPPSALRNEELGQDGLQARRRCDRPCHQLHDHDLERPSRPRRHDVQADAAPGTLHARQGHQRCRHGRDVQ